LETDGICIEGIDPERSSAMAKFGFDYGPLDSDVNELYLFHGTHFPVALGIAHEGFDMRVNYEGGGYHGQGTYFSDEACKANQYADGEPKSSCMRTLILSRVIVGDPWYTDQVNTQCRKPPKRRGTNRDHDSIIAKPGAMDGHPEKWQTHQEFVIFNNDQAYPAFIIQYVVE
jgi:hypothetical protein